MAEGEAGKTREEKTNELLRTGRLVFLQAAGYTAAQITGYGDLAALPSEAMNSLLHEKTELAIANIIGESLQKHPPPVRKIGRGRKRKK